MITSLLIAAFLGYLIGSVPYGLVLTRLAGIGDIRKIGSGNIGATNVLRTGRKDLAFLTLILDLGKAAFAALLCRYILDSEAASLMGGFMAVIGHNYPVWLKFKGGKGVASTLGMMLATVPAVGITAIIIWLVMAFSFKYSSLAALISLSVSPVIATLYGHPRAATCFALLALLSIWRHRQNIARIYRGEESKIKFKRNH